MNRLYAGMFKGPLEGLEKPMNLGRTGLLHFP